MFLHQLAPPPASLKVEPCQSPFCVVTWLSAQWAVLMQYNRVVHLDVEGTSEELLRQLSYAIKNQLVASKAPY